MASTSKCEINSRIGYFKIKEFHTKVRHILMKSNIEKDSLVIDYESVYTTHGSMKFITGIMDENMEQKKNANSEYLQEAPSRPYLCANNLAISNQVQCKATLIVVPDFTVNFWVDQVMYYILTTCTYY